MPRLTYEPRTGRYRDPKTGRFLSARDVRLELDKSLENAARVQEKLAGDLRAGRISLDSWRTEMRQLIKFVNIAGAEVAKGGRARMTRSDYGRVGQRVRLEYQHLEDWVTDIRNGLPLDGRLQVRGQDYMEGGRATHSAVLLVEMGRQGYDEVRNVLDREAEHCEDCPEITGRGWMPLSEMIPVGDRACLHRDKCHLEFRRTEAAREPVAEAELTVQQEEARAAVQAALLQGPTLSEADILAQPASAYLPARPGERETIGLFTSSAGQLTPERQRLHDAILHQHFQGAEPVAEPIVYVMGGGPASGKSVMLDKLETPGNAVTVDPDQIKTLLPEYQEGTARGDPEAATFVHEESSALAKRITAVAAEGRYNIIVDGTGDNSYENLAKKVASYRTGGARIVANYVTVDTDTAVARADARGRHTGRFVPETFIREVHRNISQVLPRAIENGLFDELTVWDNNGAAGAAKVIARYADGRLTVLDQGLWARFLAKAA